MRCRQCPFSIPCLQQGYPRDDAYVCSKCANIWFPRFTFHVFRRNRNLFWWSFKCEAVSRVKFIGHRSNEVPSALVMLREGMLTGRKLSSLQVRKCPGCFGNNMTVGNLDDREAHLDGLPLYLEDSTHESWS